MLESLLDLRDINRKPYLMLFWSFIMSSIAVLIATQVSYRVVISGQVFDLTGIFAVLFTIIPSVYFITHLIKKEEFLEEKYIKEHKESLFWERHGKDITILMFYFLGVTLSFALFAFMLPENAFQTQVAKINQIRGVSGAATEAVRFASFNEILSNNLQVMVFSFLFSFIFGAGAVFIIAWNASILGVFVGRLSKHILEIPFVTLRFLPHGIPEIAGYLCAGLAGGLLSAAVLRKSDAKVLKTIAFDSLKILFLGVVLLVVAAGIEVYL